MVESTNNTGANQDRKEEEEESKDAVPALQEPDVYTDAQKAVDAA